MRSPGSADQSISLLYVDDEPALLEIVKAFLERSAGIRVDTEETAIDALRLLETQSYDAIVSDYQMPEMDGIAFLRVLRGRGDSTPFIIFTGKGREDVVIEAFEAGADFYIQKGGDPKSQFAELERKVRRAVDLHRAESAIRESEEKYRRLVDRASQMLFLHDQHGAILDVNRKAIESTGYSREELLSMNVADIDPDVDERNDKRWLWQEAPLLEEMIFETRHRRKDGSIYPAEVHATRVTIAGEPCILALATDITSRKEKDVALQESEEKFRSIIENLQDIYYRTDARGIVTMLSPSAAGIFGYDTPDAIIGKPASDFWAYPEERKEILRRIAEYGRVLDYEVTLKRANGSPLPVSVSCHQIYDTDGQPEGIEGIIRDITARKEAEERIKESEEKYRLIAENTADTIWIADLNLKIQYISPSVQKMWGYTPEEVMGQSLQEMLTPRSFESVQKQFAGEMALEATGEADPERTIHIEFEKYRKDGTTILVENAVRFLRDRDGQPTGIIGVSRDITEWRRAEKERERNEYRFSLLANQTRAYIWEVDSKGLFTSIGPESEAIIGYMPDEIVGKLHFFDLHPEENREEFKRAVMEVFARGEPLREFEHGAIRKSGELFWISTSGIPLVDDSGNLIGYWGTDTDITERKLAEDALRTANKKLQILSGITRHDIQNKIMVLQAYLDLTRPEVDDPKLSQYLSEIDRAGNEIQRQIEFTRTYQELGVERAAWYALKDLIATKYGSKLPSFADCIGYRVLADPMIQKVFENLMENTLRHAHSTTRIGCRCEERGGQLAIIWEDNGPGIPDDLKERIFERGYGENTGLGLFLSREILAITGITIRETGEYGRGARFEMLVPAGAWQKSD